MLIPCTQVPTPAAGSLLILPRERVHPLEVPFAQAVKVISKWGSGAGELARGVSVRSLTARALVVTECDTLPIDGRQRHTVHVEADHTS